MENEGSELPPCSGWPERWRRLPRVALPILGDLLLTLVYSRFVRISPVVRGDVGTLILAIRDMIMVLTRRHASVAVAGDSAPAILASCGTILPLLLRRSALVPVPFAVLGNAIQLVGGPLVLTATLCLERSFAIIATNNGIQMGGLYCAVRHPIYVAYVLAFYGFVLAHPTPINEVILAVWLMVQVLRVRAEERLLMQDAVYMTYAEQVSYRLIPGWW